jgi:adenylate kinase family enzyme
MTKSFNFPVFKTKIEGKADSFSLDDPIERKKYFEYKAGEEIEKIREFLRHGSFLAFLLGPKNSGKGTYSKLFAEAVGSDRIMHLSVGDLVRNVHEKVKTDEEKAKLREFLQENYRGPLSVDDALQALFNRDTKTLLPDEFILALLKREIAGADKKAIFVDGFPRNLDQVSYSLYFRALMDYQDNPDFFVFIDVPENIIHERIQARVICPICNVPRSLKLLKTKEVGYDEGTKEFYLMCDNPSCKNARMVKKEGDELGIEPIRDRIELDKKVMSTLLDMHGVPKIYLRNAVPVAMASENIDDYELTPMYKYAFNEGTKSVETSTEPWPVNDDEGVSSYSLLPAAVVVGLIKQVSKTLGL